MIEVLCALVAALATVLCAFIAAQSKRQEKRCDEQTIMAEMRAKQRAEESRLLLAMVSANSQLTVGLAQAVGHGTYDNEVEEGLRQIDAAAKAYDSFLEGIARAHLAK